jgi:DNA (cytosine-5)-methyltransferase 1
MTLRVGSLCSGYGGLDLAVESVVNAELAWYAQYEPPDKKTGKPDRNQYAAQIMAHHWPGVPNHGDITAIDYSAVEPVDILTAGWPCQDMSLAGKRAGMMPGTRSGLWTHVARAIDALHPPLVYLENVRSLTSAKARSDLEFCPGCMGAAGGGADAVPHLRALGCVLGDLADLGFDAEWQVLPASGVGAPHRRERTFVLAWPADRCSRGSRWASAEDAHREPREQRRLAASGQAEGGRPRTDVAGRGGAPAADAAGDQGRISDRDGCAAPDSAHVGHERDRAARDGRTGPAHGGLGVVVPSVARGVAPDADGVGRRPGEPGDAEGQPDAARITPANTDGDAHGPQRDLGPQRPAGHHEPRRVDASGRFLGWGDYADAIARWERVLGRPAPRPVDDHGRLAAPFVEFMMGLPEGWVTAVPGIPRNALLKALGNGVVWQQGAAAFRLLLYRAGFVLAEQHSERAA